MAKQGPQALLPSIVGARGVGWYKQAWWVAVGAIARAATPTVVTAKGAYYMAPPPFLHSFLHFFSNVYIHEILYFNYFNEKKLQVPKVPWVLFDTT